MSSQEKKLAVLQQLGQQSKPIALFDLLDQLGETFKERTLRRWLDQFATDGLVQKTGQKRATKYFLHQLFWDEPEDTLTVLEEESSYFGMESQDAIARVKRPIYEREPVAYNDEWFDSYEPNSTFYLPQSIRTQLKNAGLRANKHDTAGTYAHQIFNRLLIDLAYNSSRLEGCTYSRLETERLLFHGDAPEGKLNEEKVMILNHKEAIRYLVENAPRLIVNQETIFTLHYLLSDGLVESRHSGKVRDHGVRIGGSTYMPFEDSRRLRLQMSRITQIASAIQDPFEQSFFLLVHVSYLQAFADVNKRTARLCANIPLISLNYVPLSFNDMNVRDYMTSFITIYEFQDVHPLIDLYVFSYLRTCIAYDSTVKTIRYDEVRIRYRRQRKEVLREVISQKMTGAKLWEFVAEKTNQIHTKDKDAFIEDVKKDLELMDPSRITGLGITPQQLEEWLACYSSTSCT